MLLEDLLQIRQPKTVYHGTTNKFDRFDLSKIGANNIKYGGWGIYVSDSEDVAASYTPEGSPHIIKIQLPFGEYFDLDGMVPEYIFRKLMEELEDYNDAVFEKAQSLVEEIESYGFDDYDLSGSSFYDILSHDFGSPREMSKFLEYTGLKGNTFVDRTNSSTRNYVLFSDKNIKYL